ncbi:hypothetical protein PR048_032206 [Dryococelus australis]|uniref:Uncharacterized protein n=1 Tax=Dryococelus australis TaxID=614101 RepID=A0ABQ9G1J9_9NEOP|nr:hypothetical protein PR048_032206 [Dryococelus australis]
MDLYHYRPMHCPLHYVSVTVSVNIKVFNYCLFRPSSHLAVETMLKRCARDKVAKANNVVKYEYKTAVRDIMKPQILWHFKFAETKLSSLTKSMGKVLIRGESAYNMDLNIARWRGRISAVTGAGPRAFASRVITCNLAADAVMTRHKMHILVQSSDPPHHTFSVGTGPLLPVPRHLDAETAASKERKKVDHERTHPFHGHEPHMYRLKSRKSFLRTSKEITTTTEKARLQLWKAKGWLRWKSLNRLRSRVGRSKVNLARWGYAKDDHIECDCGEDQAVQQMPQNSTYSSNGINLLERDADSASDFFRLVSPSSAAIVLFRHDADSTIEFFERVTYSSVTNNFYIVSPSTSSGMSSTSLDGSPTAVSPTTSSVKTSTAPSTSSHGTIVFFGWVTYSSVAIDFFGNIIDFFEWITYSSVTNNFFSHDDIGVFGCTIVFFGWVIYSSVTSNFFSHDDIGVFGCTIVFFGWVIYSSVTSNFFSHDADSAIDFFGWKFTYSQGARKHEETTCVKGPSCAMQHCATYKYLFQRGYKLKRHSKNCKEKPQPLDEAMSRRAFKTAYVALYNVDSIPRAAEALKEKLRREEEYMAKGSGWMLARKDCLELPQKEQDKVSSQMNATEVEDDDPPPAGEIVEENMQSLLPIPPHLESFIDCLANFWNEARDTALRDTKYEAAGSNWASFRTPRGIVPLKYRAAAPSIHRLPPSPLKKNNFATCPSWTEYYGPSRVLVIATFLTPHLSSHRLGYSPGFSDAGIVPYDALVNGFPRGSPVFPRPFIPPLLLLPSLYPYSLSPRQLVPRRLARPDIADPVRKRRAANYAQLAVGQSATGHPYIKRDRRAFSHLCTLAYSTAVPSVIGATTEFINIKPHQGQ